MSETTNKIRLIGFTTEGMLNNVKAGEVFIDSDPDTRVMDVAIAFGGTWIECEGEIALRLVDIHKDNPTSITGYVIEYNGDRNAVNLIHVAPESGVAPEPRPPVDPAAYKTLSNFGKF